MRNGVASVRDENLLTSATTVAPGTPVLAAAGPKTMQVWGATTSGAGSVTVALEGSLNKGLTWDQIGTITLTLSTTASSNGLTSNDRYSMIRGDVTAISGTGAWASAQVGY